MAGTVILILGFTVLRGYVDEEIHESALKFLELIEETERELQQELSNG